MNLLKRILIELIVFNKGMRYDMSPEDSNSLRKWMIENEKQVNRTENN